MRGFSVHFSALRALLLLLALIPAVLCLRQSQAWAERPNVILIQTDDQARSTVRAQWRNQDNRVRRVMPNLLARIADRGTEFTRYYATQPVCGPSRAALLTGQYAHTSGLKRNSGPTGGWTGWQQLPLLDQNLATELQSSGYRTVHVGKFTNGYTSAPGVPEVVVPPGWDRWHTMTYDSAMLYYGYTLNQNGSAVGPFGSSGYDTVGSETDPVTCTQAILTVPVTADGCNHATDIYTRTAVDEIRQAGDRPLYLQLDYNTPHGDHRPPNGPQPATRHYDTAFGNRTPRSPSYDESDIRDKPAWLRRIALRLTSSEMRQIDIRWAKELEALRAVDEGIGAIFETLKETGKLNNTYVIYISDNGLFHGEHRLSSAKFLPYEPSARVPMMIRGPSVPKGRRSAELAANIDLAPTVLELAGVQRRGRLDGRSLRPYWRNPARRTRRPLFIESWVGSAIDAGEETELLPAARSGAHISVAAPPLSYRGIRVGAYKYVEYPDGGRELYDLARDPHELTNQISSPRYHAVAVRLRHLLAKRRDCRAALCRRPVASMPRVTPIR